MTNKLDGFVTVQQLIEFLMDQNPNLPVIYRQYSSFSALNINDIEIESAFKYQGNLHKYFWNQWANLPEDQRPKSFNVLCFPGN